jgi:hypothetical protein
MDTSCTKHFYSESTYIIIMSLAWESNKYDFSDPDVRIEWVQEMACTVGGCISMLKKSWRSYKAARHEGYADRCLELENRINSIQRALGLEENQFG